MRSISLLVCALVAAPALGGCLAAAPNDVPGGRETPDPPSTALPRMDRASRAETLHLGLAWYADVARERVAPHVAEGFELTPCVGNGSRTDVFVVVDETRYLDAPDGPVTVRLVALLTCATPPHRFVREDANEPPWYEVAAWAETTDEGAFYSNVSTAPRPARVSVAAAGTGGFTFSAHRGDGERLVEGRLAAPASAPGLTACTPETLRGRILAVGGDGRVGAVDWNKTESTCQGAATLAWSAASPLADILGPQRPPAAAFHVDVHDARFSWWTMGRLER